jgi:hypothetical protein
MVRRVVPSSQRMTLETTALQDLGAAFFLLHLSLMV